MWAQGPVWTGEKNLAPPGFDTQTAKPVASRYTELPGSLVCRCSAIIIDFQGFRFSSSLSVAYETGGLGRGFEGNRLGKGITCGSKSKGQNRKATIQRSESNLRYAAIERFGATTLSSVRK